MARRPTGRAECADIFQQRRGQDLLQLREEQQIEKRFSAHAVADSLLPTQTEQQVREGPRESHKIMPRFDEEDNELIDMMREYEKYARSSHGEIEDFDEWLETEYGKSKSKVMKPSKKGRSPMKGQAN